MKKELKFSSYQLWRERVENCKTKHAAKRTQELTGLNASGKVQFQKIKALSVNKNI